MMKSVRMNDVTTYDIEISPEVSDSMDLIHNAIFDLKTTHPLS